MFLGKDLLEGYPQFTTLQKNLLLLPGLFTTLSNNLILMPTEFRSLSNNLILLPAEFCTLSNNLILMPAEFRSVSVVFLHTKNKALLKILSPSDSIKLNRVLSLSIENVRTYLFK